MSTFPQPEPQPTVSAPSPATGHGLSAAPDEMSHTGAMNARAGESQGTNRREIPPLPRGDVNANPPGVTLWQLIKEDYNTHGRRLLQQGFLVLALHRFGNWRMGIRNKWLRLPLSIIYKMLYPWTEMLCGIKLSYNVIVGRRVKIEHFGGMVLGARSIGDDCIIRQNTTFGIARIDEDQGKPIIEDRVNIGCGACLLGHIRIGHDSIIGANAVVVTDVPPYSVVVGVPGRIIKTRKPEAQQTQRVLQAADGGQP